MIDFRNTGAADSDVDLRVCAEFLIADFAFCGAEFLRVVQSERFEIRRQNHRSRDHRPGEWSATRFVDASDEAGSAGLKQNFVKKSGIAMESGWWEVSGSEERVF